MATRDFHIKI